MTDQQSKGPAVESGTRTDPQPPSGQQQPRVPITSVHLRQHLIGVLAAVDMPETTRTAVVDELIAAGDVHQETFPHRAGAGDAQRRMLAHHAALTIWNPYPESVEKAPDLTGEVSR